MGAEVRDEEGIWEPMDEENAGSEDTVLRTAISNFIGRVLRVIKFCGRGVVCAVRSSVKGAVVLSLVLPASGCLQKPEKKPALVVAPGGNVGVGGEDVHVDASGVADVWGDNDGINQEDSGVDDEDGTNPEDSGVDDYVGDGDDVDGDGDGDGGYDYDLLYEDVPVAGDVSIAGDLSLEDVLYDGDLPVTPDVAPEKDAGGDVVVPLDFPVTDELVVVDAGSDDAGGDLPVGPVDTGIDDMGGDLPFGPVDTGTEVSVPLDEATVVVFMPEGGYCEIWALSGAFDSVTVKGGPYYPTVDLAEGDRAWCIADTNALMGAWVTFGPEGYEFCALTPPNSGAFPYPVDESTCTSHYYSELDTSAYGGYVDFFVPNAD